MWLLPARMRVGLSKMGISGQLNCEQWVQIRSSRVQQMMLLRMLLLLAHC